MLHEKGIIPKEYTVIMHTHLNFELLYIHLRTLAIKLFNDGIKLL